MANVIPLARTSATSLALLDDDDQPSVEELAAAAPRTTDSANADAVARENGGGYLFVLDWGVWIAWNGKYWDRTGARHRVIHAALLTARLEHYRSLGHLRALEEDARKKALAGQKDEDLEARIKAEQRLLKWHEQSQNTHRLEAAVKLLETTLTVRHRQLDSCPWKLNLANGTLDLRSATLRQHDRSDLLTQMCDVEWSNAARAPVWEDFVSAAMGGQIDLVLYLQRLVGYSITALTTEHVLAFFFGAGRNGKSTFINIIRRLLGEYACAAPRELLFEDRVGGSKRHPTELARLYGKRVAFCAEIGENAVLDEAKVKDLTGGDAVSVRRMHEDFWDLTPTHTLFMSGNHKPTVRGDDLGIWRRVRLVPWLVTVEESEVDRDLPAKLESELPGILRWVVQGCLEWQRIGLAEPAVVTDATKDYRAESDILGEFFDRHLVFGDGERVSRKALRECYESWCEEIGHRPVGAKKLAQRLREHGVGHVAVRDGLRIRDGWQGVRLRGEYDTEPELRVN